MLNLYLEMGGMLGCLEKHSNCAGVWRSSHIVLSSADSKYLKVLSSVDSKYLKMLSSVDSKCLKVLSSVD